jgi:hypothetical protein
MALHVEHKRLEKEPSRRPAKDRIYIFHQGENILQNLLKRYNRPVEFYRKEVLPKVVPEAMIKEYKWSQTAGCRCGCSPGFIGPNFSNHDTFVTISDDEAVYKTDRQQAIVAEDRAAAEAFIR